MGFIINPYQVQPSSAYGTLTTSWIAATGETDTTILGALNTLESDLSTYGLTSKIDALYPMVGGTSTKHSYNFMNTAAHQITFGGGWTHSSTGALPNGTNAYADTQVIPNTSLSLTSNHFGIYSRTNLAGGNYASHGQRVPSGDPAIQLSIARFDMLAYYGSPGELSGNNTANGGIQSNSAAFYLGTRRASNDIALFRNTTKIGSNTNTMVGSSLSTDSLYLSAVNAGGFPNGVTYDNKQIALASIGDGLTDTEAANFYTAVQTFQTTLGRSVGTQTVSDSDAQAFVTAASITDQVQATAVNNLVIGLKADSLWTKMKAIYPMVGGTSSTHKWNLKDPVDSDAAFRLVFNGGWTHSSTGALPNGSNGYADTKLIPSSSLTQNSSHISIYNRTNTDGLYVDMGTRNATAESILLTRWSNGTLFSHNTDYGLRMAPSNSDSRGHYMVSRRSSSDMEAYKNGSSISTSSANSNASTYSIYLSAWNDSGSPNYYTSREIAFSSIGDGLTDTEASNFYTRVQTYQTALSRNV